MGDENTLDRYSRMQGKVLQAVHCASVLRPERAWPLVAEMQ